MITFFGDKKTKKPIFPNWSSETITFFDIQIIRFVDQKGHPWILLQKVFKDTTFFSNPNVFFIFLNFKCQIIT